MRMGKSAWNCLVTHVYRTAKSDGRSIESSCDGKFTAVLTLTGKLHIYLHKKTCVHVRVSGTYGVILHTIVSVINVASVMYQQRQDLRHL